MITSCANRQLVLPLLRKIGQNLRFTAAWRRYNFKQETTDVTLFAQPYRHYTAEIARGRRDTQAND